MIRDQCYLENPLPYLNCSNSWIGILSQAINDQPMSILVHGYYDEKKHVIVLLGEVLAAPPNRGDFLTADNFSTGLDIISNTMVVVGNVTGAAATTGASALCCVTM